jgi:hypothetical protein
MHKSNHKIRQTVIRAAQIGHRTQCGAGGGVQGEEGHSDEGEGI